MDNTDTPKILSTHGLAFVMPDSFWPDGDPEAVSGGCLPLYIERYAGPRSRAKTLGFHPYWEIVYSISGTGIIEFTSSDLELGEGAGILIPPGEAHREISDSDRWETLWFAFRRLPDGLQVDDLVYLADGRALQDWAEEIWAWRHRQAGVLGPELDALSTFFIRAFIRLSRIGAKRRQQSWLPRVLDHIREHLSDDLSVADLARVARLSPGHFHRRFKNEMNQTPLNYLTDQRLQASLILLRQSDLAVKAVARAVGYHDPLYFSRAFRKRFGFSPSETNTVAVKGSQPQMHASP